MDEPYDDLYAIVGVPADAARVDIVRAYRRQARELHPDTHPGDPAAAGAFRQLRAAYDVLADPTRRRTYDRQRGLDPPPLSPPHGTTASTVFSTAGMAGDAILRIGPVHVEPPPRDTHSTPLYAASRFIAIIGRRRS